MTEYMDEKFEQEHKHMFIKKDKLKSMSQHADFLVTENTKSVRIFNYICRK